MASLLRLLFTNGQGNSPFGKAALISFPAARDEIHLVVEERLLRQEKDNVMTQDF